MNVEAFLTIRLSAILTKNNGRKIEKLGHFYSRNKLHSLIFFFFTILNKWPLVMNPIVWSNLINGSIACRVMVGVDSIAWKETKLPYCYIKAVFRALALPFTPFLKRFHLPVISYSSSIHFMRFTFPSGEASPHWWAPKWSECKELWWKIHQSE